MSVETHSGKGDASQSETYLAKPPGDCCLEGTIHKGEPRGSFATIANVETYIATPKEGAGNGHVVLYFSDVWGFFVNNFLLMDGFADAGYTVLGLDYFRGEPIWKHRKSKNDKSDPNFDFDAWVQKHVAFARVAAPAWSKAVREQYGKQGTKFACVGYCFGAPYVCDELASGAFVAGAFAHPAFLKESHFSDLKAPLFLSCAETDHTFSSESRRKAVDILQAEKKIYQLQLFSGVEHGFAVRCNVENPYERYVKEQSLKGIIDFFNFWLL